GRAGRRVAVAVVGDAVAGDLDHGVGLGDGQVAVDVADAVVAQAAALRGAGGDGVGRAGHAGRGGVAGAGQRDAADVVAVDQAAGAELAGAVGREGRAVGLALVLGRDRQGRLGDRVGHRAAGVLVVAGRVVEVPGVAVGAGVGVRRAAQVQV